LNRAIPQSAICLAAALVPAGVARAADARAPDGGPDAGIVVYGRSEHRIGMAVAASEGAIAGADIANRPLLRPAELLEAVPGLIASQHSGGGKANQYFLRGFNLDHGTDFALSIDDMPMNLRTHGHGQGYLDVGGLIPEAVARIDYRKGPYRADAGDFAFVGAARITTRDTMKPEVTAELGSFGYRRLVGGGSVGIGEADLLLLGQWKEYDGPWALPEAMRSFSGLAKLSAATGLGKLSASLSVYRARWRPTEQIPERAIGTLLPDRFGTLDPSLSGRTDRQVLTVSIKGDDLRATLWAQRYDWSLFSNFTYFLDDPVNGDQLRQHETMWGLGGKVERDVRLAQGLTLTAGAEFRHDDIGSVGLDQSTAGVVRAVRSDFAVRESSAAIYGELVWKPSPLVQLQAALRSDGYRFRVRAKSGAAWSGDRDAGLVTTKFGASINPAPGLAFYGNIGEGFHSNDARGVTAPSSPAPALVRGRFIEGGLRYEAGNLVLTANHWWSRIGSELIYVGDSGAVEPSGAGKRRGYELTLFWRPAPWMAVDAVWTGAKSRFSDLPTGANRIPGALESSGELGLSVNRQRWNAALRVRRLGPHALTEDNRERGKPTTLVNLRLGLEAGRWELFADLLNLLNSRGHDVEYIYATRLPGEPPEGVEGRNSRTVEPRQLRLGVRARW
jgi:hypothetical protein